MESITRGERQRFTTLARGEQQSFTPFFIDNILNDCTRHYIKIMIILQPSQLYLKEAINFLKYDQIKLRSKFNNFQ